MEPIKITVVSTSLSTPQVFMSSSSNLGELKSELRSKDIDIQDKTFKEGVTKIELVSDTTELPRFKADGTAIPELVIMMTGTTKKIKSGAGRQEILAIVKRMVSEDPSLKAVFGNYTIRTSADLEILITKYSKVTPRHIAPCVSEALASKETATKNPTLNLSDYIKKTEVIALLEDAITTLKGEVKVAPIEIPKVEKCCQAEELPKEKAPVALTSGFSAAELARMTGELED